MKADIECHGCCVRKAEGLLEQYQVPDEKKAQVMEAVLETVKGAGAEESAPVMMARVMRILESEVGITDAYDIPKQRYNELLCQKKMEYARRYDRRRIHSLLCRSMPLQELY